jgi:phosphoribosylformimino-5-aminoimidazole carboxamide ribonucleotide (ProFAR) isomerase
MVKSLIENTNSLIDAKKEQLEGWNTTLNNLWTILQALGSSGANSVLEKAFGVEGLVKGFAKNPKSATNVALNIVKLYEELEKENQP